jgi:hypothetical protein
MQWKVVRRARNASATLGWAGIPRAKRNVCQGRASITFEKSVMEGEGAGAGAGVASQVI